ncbi:TadE/TadG family type IV pilus assembly protein [Mesorhizobium silamurunense]|uniref:TadE/TadG family type IV pilus assembly protein n=1 Tax=Mesorhizobium silamurunense TaxID=499528 RepID=UPI00177CF395|nr:pilus assembly protein TadG-related protein [Mesorhizobium silamurunense]
MLRVLREFWNDQRGIAMILVAIMLPVLVGFALVTIDMSRATGLHNDLQKGIDALALAGAGELDGRPDSITRANRAITNLIANRTLFSTSGDHQIALADVTVTYLTGIPASDDIRLGADGVDANGVNWASTDPEAVSFAEVTVNASGAGAFETIFPASFNGGDNTMEIRPQAVAGFQTAVCDFTPIFICNPYENDPLHTLQDAAADPNLRRRLIEVRKVGNGAAAGPGNFGFLEPPAGVGNGAKGLAETIATSKPTGCYGRKGVDTKTGQNAGPVQDAFNVRFGIRATGGGFNTAAYGPAANVRKGAKKTSGGAGQCPAMNQLTFGLAGNMGLPRDNSFPYINGRMGDGNWPLSTYWSTNFGSTSMPAGWSVTKPTRYDVYKYEQSAGLVNHASTGGETGTPANACPAAITSIDRRLLYGAILNCSALEAEGNDLSGHSVGVPVEAFGSFFITEPVMSAADDASVMVELVDISAGGQGTLDKFVRNEAQLYR